MTGWSWADVLEVVADVRADAVALRNGDDVLTWHALERRTAALAAFFVEAGLGRQAKVAQYLYNANEYLESALGAIRAGMVPVNTNYRYVADELAYLWDNADVDAVVHHGAFVPVIDAMRAKVPRIRTWVWVDDGTEACPSWAVPYEEAVSTAPKPPPWALAGDDLVLQYTGGTTGRPKGVMWRQHDLYRFFSDAALGDPPEPDLAAVRRRLTETPSGVIALPAAPLMHATSAFVSYQTLFEGGAVSTLASRRFDVEELLDVIERDGVTFLSIVGDVFARPLVEALGPNLARRDVSSLRVVLSSGVMWSQEVKDRLLELVPQLTLVDVFASSEALGGGRAVARTGSSSSSTAAFRAGGTTRVVRDDGTDVERGSGEVGLVAIGGYVPVGYYKDSEKSAATFRTIEGVRYSIPGDHATVEADGTLRLLGRGSNCINTGGEKVYPEEVEEALKEHPHVVDAAVVGLPDPRYGESVGAVVAIAEGNGARPDELRAFLRGRLAGYKVPRTLIVGPVDRAANGKLDYAAARQALAGVGES